MSIDAQVSELANSSETARFKVTIPKTNPPQLDSVGALVGSALRREVENFSSSDPVSTKKTTPDALHDARVALRRVRSILRTFRTIVDPGWAAQVRAELGWFAALLGAVRQVDIFGEHLARYDEWSTNESARDLITQRLQLDRNGFMQTLIEAGNSERYEKAIGYLEVVRCDPPFTTRSSEAFEPALTRILQRPWRDLRAAARLAQGTKDEVHLHSMRIRAKELRYAAETAAEPIGPSLSRVAKAASAIQDRLGEHRDALQTAAFLEELAEDQRGVGFLAGQLVVRERTWAESLLGDLPDDLRRLKRRWKQVRWQ